MLELLSPVGDFDCLKAAVQNGANSVYFGSSSFSARAYANNFDADELEKAISYCKLRNCKTNLALNTLIKEDEFDEALDVATKAYKLGIDNIIVQDLGLSKILIDKLPNASIHASTQVSIHNLEGALEAQRVGYTRVVLARELSIDDIEYIAKNTDVELECFIHGALCISYSGQCLFSSVVGGRSGNRGKCAGTCRMKYDLVDNKNTICDSGHLLSPRDLCALDYLPRLVKSGVKCFKIEGRMKSPEYVATVTRIYRKYIDLALSKDEYIVDSEDKKDLMQVFNRGNFSNGHFETSSNRNLICKEKPNNSGLFLGIVEKYSSTTGYITIKTKERLAIGDSVALEHEDGLYNVSELMISNNNIKLSKTGDTITIGRMKGNINPGDKVFKMTSKRLTHEAKESLKNENKHSILNVDISLKKEQAISITLHNAKFNIHASISTEIIPQEAKKHPLLEETIVTQLQKTGNTPFEFKDINISLDDNLFLPLGDINELRRLIFTKAEQLILGASKRNFDTSELPRISDNILCKNTSQKNTNKPISVLLNKLYTNMDYTKLDTDNIDNIYIPVVCFLNASFNQTITHLSESCNIFLVLPTIIKPNFKNIFSNLIEKTIENFNITGLVLSNISNIYILEDLQKENKIDLSKYELIANYNLNVFNSNSVSTLKTFGLKRFTISPELDKAGVDSLLRSSLLDSELIVYGKTQIMTMKYCVLGNSNKCYPECDNKCLNNKNYYLKDRLGYKFLFIPDNVQTISTLYNSKITSIFPDQINSTSVRIDIINESIEDINYIVSTVKSNNRLDGPDFTTGNLNRPI